VNEQDAWVHVRAAIGQVAPDVDPVDLVEGARLRQDLELDSLDFLRVLETLVARTGVDIPERAYAEVGTVKGLVGYLVTHG
jgi:acyl carrier protein